MRTDPILVVGAGAIGAIVGVHLIEAGYTVHFADANTAHVAAVKAAGIKLSGHRERYVKAPIMAPDEVDGTYPIILLAVKAPHTMAALPTVEKAIAPDGCVVSLQNGLEEYKIARVVGAERTIGAYLTFGGFYVEPGHVKHGGAGSFKIGEIDGSMSPRAKELAGMLSALQPVGITDNIFGYLWAKMALGSVYFGTAIIDKPVLDVYASEQARSVLETLCGEVVMVADAMGVRIESSDGFDPKSFRPGASDTAARQASWEAQRRYWGSHDNPVTGVWRDLAIHKRPTEVDFQIGPIIAIAKEKGIAVPHLERLLGTVKAIEKGKQAQSFEALLELVVKTQ